MALISHEAATHFNVVRYERLHALHSLKQDAYIRNRKTNNDWRVRLSNGVKLPYTIKEVAHDYSYSIVGLPNREQVWILSRESTMHDSLYNSLKGRIQDEGFDISQLQKVPQTVFH